MNWNDKIEKFCDFYNIPPKYLAETLYEPKVIPMIRGKAFEFSVMLALQKILPKDEFEVTKTPMNAQFGSHDQDVSVLHKPTGAQISVECKLAAKGKFKTVENGYEIRVKCMRSRTVGEKMAERLSGISNIPKETILIHSDQYLPSDFDIVITTIGNAFYETNKTTGLFEWSPNTKAVQFLRKLRGQDNETSLKDFTFYSLYVAPTSGLAVKSANEIRCTRRKCKDFENCGFIPNYPTIQFSLDTRKISTPWLAISDATALFRFVARQKTS